MELGRVPGVDGVAVDRLASFEDLFNVGKRVLLEGSSYANRGQHYW